MIEAVAISVCWIFRLWMRDDRCKKTLFHCLLSASTLHKNLPGTYITCRFLNFDRATLSSKNLEWWDFCLLIKLKALQGVMKYFNSLTTSLSLLDDIFQSVNNNLNIFPRIPNNLGTCLFDCRLLSRNINVFHKAWEDAVDVWFFNTRI